MSTEGTHVNDRQATDVHAHEVLHLIVDADTPWTVDGLRREVENRFGGDCRFCSCSAHDMDFDRLLEFLLQRRKIAVVDGSITADPAKICQHD